jgi:hypothetical protein
VNDLYRNKAKEIVQFLLNLLSIDANNKTFIVIIQLWNSMTGSGCDGDHAIL